MRRYRASQIREEIRVALEELFQETGKIPTLNKLMKILGKKFRFNEIQIFEIRNHARKLIEYKKIDEAFDQFPERQFRAPSSISEASKRKLMKRAKEIVDEIWKEKLILPNINNFIARLRKDPEFIQVTPEELRKLALETLDRKRNQRATPGQYDAMSRTVSGGFESNRRRH